MNIWTEVGLCNGALGNVLDFVYADGQNPPTLPISVIVQFDENYNDPSLSATLPGCVNSNLSSSTGFSKPWAQM